MGLTASGPRWVGPACAVLGVLGFSFKAILIKLAYAWHPIDAITLLALRMLFGLSRVAATEFSFFLAIPTLFAATGYSLWKDSTLLSAQSLPAFGVGFVAAFVSAFACVRWLIRYVAHHDFVPFAWYRIAFGAVILVTAWAGLVRWD